MTSDILILLKEAANEQAFGTIANAIYKATRTAVVTFDHERAKILLIKFDPEKDTPEHILKAVLGTGHEAVMAGG